MLPGGGVYERASEAHPDMAPKPAKAAAASNALNVLRAGERRPVPVGARQRDGASCKVGRPGRLPVIIVA